MWEKKANTATVITQNSVLSVESLFATFVKNTTGGKKKPTFAVSLKCTNHSFTVCKLNALWILLASIFKPEFQCTG